MKGCNTLAAAVLCLAYAVPAHPAEPLDTVLAAFSANEAAAKNRSVLTMDVDGAMDVYVIERVKPDRLRVVHNPDRADAQEAVIIGSTMYVRRPSGWSRRPAVVAAPGAIPSIDGLLKSGISDLKERTATAGAQRFSGRMTWSNGGAKYDGQIDIVIDAGTPMLRTVAFEGTCGTKPCRFSQTFSYSTSLTIATPK